MREWGKRGGRQTCITEACSTKSLLTNTCITETNKGFSTYNSDPDTVQPFLTQRGAKVHANYNHTTLALQSTLLIGFITHISLCPPKFNGCLTCYCFFKKNKNSKFVPFSTRDANQIKMLIININQSALSPGASIPKHLFSRSSSSMTLSV